MKHMKELVLRNLSVSGGLPDYIGDMSTLKVLDLSFNNLSGAIPSSFDSLQESIKFMYFTSNRLSGTIPSWILNSKDSLDLSYNNFTGSPPFGCQERYVNLISSFSSTNNSSSIPSCLSCSENQKNHNLFINCGGDNVTIEHNEYEADTSPRGASTFIVDFYSGKWAYSSTGSFVNNDQAKYIAQNTSILNMTNPELYTRVRLSAISLRYYGLCLQKGSYTVMLHFAEIMFTDDQTYSSVGRRLFDVSIQGQKVLQDFDIAKEANGTGKEINKTFTVEVDGTLEIHLHWAGKGTNSIPQRGIYGPLISAISVTPNFKPGHRKISVGAILGIVAACLVVILVISFLVWFYTRRKIAENNELRGLELQPGYFSLRQIKAATRNFDPENKIGEGGFGSVYKGLLSDGTIIAVKQLSSRSHQGNHEFVNEVGMISALQHPNLVKLYGCCTEDNQLLLIYEYMENNSLARALFDSQHKLELDWPTRCKICLGIARGLAYLHEESRLKIVHRDIKASNVLLDRDLNAKISDFGLAKLHEEDHSHISTRVAGTIGYMAPEYAMRGHLTAKANVYSFGVVALELVSGKSNTSYRPDEEFVNLLDWAFVLQEKGNLLELVDPNLGLEYSNEEAKLMLDVALMCTNASPTLRPSMSQVVSWIEGRTPVQPLRSSLSFPTSSSKSKGIRRSFSADSSIVALCDENDASALCDENDASALLLRASPVQPVLSSLSFPASSSKSKGIRRSFSADCSALQYVMRTMKVHHVMKIMQMRFS